MLKTICLFLFFFFEIICIIYWECKVPHPPIHSLLLWRKTFQNNPHPWSCVVWAAEEWRAPITMRNLYDAHRKQTFSAGLPTSLQIQIQTRVDRCELQRWNDISKSCVGRSSLQYTKSSISSNNGYVHACMPTWGVNSKFLADYLFTALHICHVRLEQVSVAKTRKPLSNTRSSLQWYPNRGIGSWVSFRFRGNRWQGILVHKVETLRKGGFN